MEKTEGRKTTREQKFLENYPVELGEKFGLLLRGFYKGINSREMVITTMQGYIEAALNSAEGLREAYKNVKL